MQRYGGLWDHRANNNEGDYVGDADRSRVLSIHKGQVEAAEWFIDWFDKFWLDEKPRDYSGMFAGGRRGGKSWLAVAAAVAYAVTVPDSLVWIVSPTEPDYEEVMDYLTSFMPREWYMELGHPWWRYTLANHSRIVLRSAAQNLKKGRADFVVLNEGQQMKEVRFAQTRAAVSDVGGMCLIACNPPDDGDVGEWVGDFAVEAEAGERDATYHFIDPLLNPHIDVEALLALAKELDPRTFDIQVRGKFLSPSEAVFYNWDRPMNEVKPPELGDITERFTRVRSHKAVKQIIGLDVGRFPRMVAVVFRVFKHPVYESLDKALLWAVDEITIDGDEAALCAEAEARGYFPDETLVILDASGWWQTQETAGIHKAHRKQKKFIRGRGSVHVMRDCGWFNVKRPDRRMKVNPDNIECARAVCARIGNAVGYRKYKAEPERFFFADPRLRVVCKSMRMWKYKNGKPDRNSEHAHAGDAVGYVVWHFWPRRRIIDKSHGVALGDPKKTKGTTNVY